MQNVLSQKNGLSGNERSVSWFFPHPVAWMGCLVLALVELVWILSTDFTLSFGRFSYAALYGFSLVVVATLLSKRNMHLLAIGTYSLAFFMFFGKQANVLNYLAHGLGMPMADNWLAEVEQAMGFDWLAILELFNRFPVPAILSFGIYNILELLTAFCVLSLILLGMFRRCQEFVLLFALTAMITIVIGAIFPAGGTYHFYQPEPYLLDNLPPEPGRFFLKHLIPIHDGSMRHIDLERVTGLITFPSFHTTMALLMAWSLRGTVLFGLFSFLAGIIIIATPVFGGHYLTDLLGGLGVMIVGVYLLNIMNRREAAQSAERLQLRLIYR